MILSGLPGGDGAKPDEVGTGQLEDFKALAREFHGRGQLPASTRRFELAVTVQRDLLDLECLPHEEATRPTDSGAQEDLALSFRTFGRRVWMAGRLALKGGSESSRTSFWTLWYWTKKFIGLHVSQSPELTRRQVFNTRQKVDLH